MLCSQDSIEIERNNMAKSIFVNLIVDNLSDSKRFFEKLGWSFNPQFTNDEAAAMVINESIYAMLHTPESIRRFTQKEIVDSKNFTEVLLALQLESREEVDDFMKRVEAAGGSEQREPEEHGFMYGRAFEDLDGHIWEVFWMDPSQMPTPATG